MPVIDKSRIPPKTGSIYPEPWASQMAGRSSIALGDAGGLTQYGVRITTLEPGALSSLRHWHRNEDEFVMVLTGTLVLIDDDGEHPLGPGDCAAFPAGDANGHHFVNRSGTAASFLVVGTRAPEETAWYSDVDLRVEISGGTATFTRRDGSPLPEAG